MSMGQLQDLGCFVHGTRRHIELGGPADAEGVVTFQGLFQAHATLGNALQLFAK
jgi:hypothetical protein